MNTEELIKRLEAATGPSREMDDDIAYAAGWTRTDILDEITGPETVWHDGKRHLISTPRFTSSIDAALTLVPEDASSWDCGRIDTDFLASVEFPVDVDGFHNYHAKSRVNAAIAITAAALKARVSK